MFYYVSGKVAHLEPNLAVIDCGGVGYACHTTLNTVKGLTAGESACLYTYLAVREDAMDLYGFHDPEELSCFKMLIGITGVGPKAALSILSVATPARLALSILTGDERALTGASGIGKKLAQRIILELKDKMAKSQPQSPGGASIPAASSGAGGASEAVQALMVLGYSPSEAGEAVGSVGESGLPVEEMIKRALKKLARG